MAPANGLGGNGGHAFGGAAGIAGSAIIVNCTLVTNSAAGGAGAPGDVLYQGYYGGNGGDAFGGGMVAFTNCAATNLTFSGNVVAPGTATTNGQPYWVNGIYGHGYGVSIANTGGVFQIVNSILSGGTNNNCFGVIADLGHNLSSDATPAWTSGTSLNNTDALLLPLADIGVGKSGRSWRTRAQTWDWLRPKK